MKQIIIFTLLACYGITASMSNKNSNLEMNNWYNNPTQAIGNTLNNAEKEIGNTVGQSVDNSVDNLRKAADQTVNNAEDKIDYTANNLANNANSAVNNGKQNVQNGYNNTLNAVNQKAQSVANGVNNSVNSAVNNVNGAVNNAANIVNGSVNNANQNVNNAAAAAISNPFGNPNNSNAPYQANQKPPGANSNNQQSGMNNTSNNNQIPIQNKLHTLAPNGNNLNPGAMKNSHQSNPSMPNMNNPNANPNIPNIKNPNANTSMPNMNTPNPDPNTNNPNSNNGTGQGQVTQTNVNNQDQPHNDKPALTPNFDRSLLPMPKPKSQDKRKSKQPKYNPDSYKQLLPNILNPKPLLKTNGKNTSSLPTNSTQQNPQSDPNANQQLNPQINPNSKIQPNPQANTNSQSQPNPQPEPNANIQNDPNSQPQSIPQLNSNKNQQLNPQPDPNSQNSEIPKQDPTANNNHENNQNQLDLNNQNTPNQEKPSIQFNSILKGMSEQLKTLIQDTDECLPKEDLKLKNFEKAISDMSTLLENLKTQGQSITQNCAQKPAMLQMITKSPFPQSDPNSLPSDIDQPISNNEELGGQNPTEQQATPAFLELKTSQADIKVDIIKFNGLLPIIFQELNKIDNFLKCLQEKGKASGTSLQEFMNNTKAISDKLAALVQTKQDEEKNKFYANITYNYICEIPKNPDLVNSWSIAVKDNNPQTKWVKLGNSLTTFLSQIANKFKQNLMKKKLRRFKLY